VTARTQAVDALVTSGATHVAAERVVALLEHAGVGFHDVRALGERPDLVDRDGDRWREHGPDRWWMVRDPDHYRTPDPSAMPRRAQLDGNYGPLVAVPRENSRKGAVA
jgi:hypothetical protein